jgi:hypothetical protein
VEGGSDVSIKEVTAFFNPGKSCRVDQDVFDALGLPLRLTMALTQPCSHLGTVLQPLDLTFGEFDGRHCQHLHVREAITVGLVQFVAVRDEVLFKRSDRLRRGQVAVSTQSSVRRYVPSALAC